jgi:hypothetical protein
MPSPTTPVEDSVEKVNDEIAVGSDLEFQHRWWRFERVIWTLFGLLILADLLGFFGRGPFAKTHRRTSDGTMDVQYERIERSATPSILIVQFGPSAIREGKVRLWVSETMVKGLGAQRVIPQPSASAVGDGGISYTFSAGTAPASVQFALQPLTPGIHTLSLRVPGSEQMTMKILVMP